MNEPTPDKMRRAKAGSVSPGDIAALLAVLLMVLLGVSLRWESLSSAEDPDGYLLSDPDSALHLHLMKRSRAEGVLYVRDVPWDGAPMGRPNEWSVANTLFLRGASAVYGNTPDGEARFLAAVPPLIGGLMILVPSLLAMALAQRSLAVCWAVTGALLPGQVASHLSGLVDHHALQVASWTIALSAFALFATSARPWLGIVAGIAQGYLFVLGPMEHLPIFVLTAGLALFDSVRSESMAEARQFWHRWGVSGFAVVLIVAAIAGFPHERMEILGLWHVLLWGLVLLPLLAPSRWRARWILAGVGMGAVLLMVALVHNRGAEPLTIMQDPLFPAHARVIQELHRYPGTILQVSLRLFGDGGLLWLAPLLLLFRGKLSAEQLRWTIALTALVLLALAWIFSMSRGIRIASPILAIVPALLISQLRTPAWSQVLIFLVAIALPVTNTLQWRLSMDSGSDSNQLRMREYHRAARALARDIGEGTPSVVLLPLDGAPFFLLEKSARTVGSFYWSNLDGMMDAATLMTTRSEEEFRTISTARQVELILLPPEDLRGAMFSAAATVRWDNRRDRIIPGDNVLLRLAGREQELRVATPELTRAAPGWVLLRNPYLKGDR